MARIRRDGTPPHWFYIVHALFLFSGLDCGNVLLWAVYIHTYTVKPLIEVIKTKTSTTSL